MVHIKKKKKKMDLSTQKIYGSPPIFKGMWKNKSYGSK